MLEILVEQNNTLIVLCGCPKIFRAGGVISQHGLQHVERHSFSPNLNPPALLTNENVRNIMRKPGARANGKNRSAGTDDAP
ncbi:hypothetical protein R3B23_004239 [Salmonella enterica]|uniref:Uncharacterized protein n=1 Tax=Salmonella enterica TaxID=28901 RepID=A0A744T4Y0_SALER|nr:hypothetical protein [Salmonella enterica]ECY9399812.1 hypothetical protein [Salmonella enterica subsp. enterica serovar Derby]EDI2475601.1 hypothetical protein [Salmonella enterica subsp. enterica serovar Heidelberg]EDX8328111.1 hypothetical protein [Salmonella enterica subsp. enterica]EBE1322459.1 hypothetical protein [Salmonella enterica]